MVEFDGRAVSPSPVLLARPPGGVVAGFYPSGVHQCTYWLDPAPTVAARLGIYRRWIACGWFPDLRAAYAHDRRLYSEGEARARRNRGAIYAAWRNGRAMRCYQFHRALVFAWPRRCAYCGGPSDNADHVIPRALGGSNHFENLTPACRRCNEDKGGRTPEQWVAYRVKRGRSWPMPGAVHCPSP